MLGAANTGKVSLGPKSVALLQQRGCEQLKEPGRFNLFDYPEGCRIYIDHPCGRLNFHVLLPDSCAR